MPGDVSAVIFEGIAAGGPVEKMVAGVRRAALLDNLEKLKQVSLIDAVYLVTNDGELAELARAENVRVFLNDLPPSSFHFGAALRDLIVDRKLKKVFYLSGAGCPLITVSEIISICRRLQERDNLVYTNNTQSADIVAFHVPDRIAEAELPPMDNALAMTLRDQLGLEQELMPHTLGLLFDLDTPSDILVLGGSPFGGPRTREAIKGLDLDYSTLNRAKAVLAGSYQEVALMGRVGAPVMERLNSTLKLRLRVFSEERGMKSLGRLQSGEVVSLMGYLIQEAGIPAFFRYLSQVARCAFIDTRVLMAHHKFAFSTEERFKSDLGLWKEIQHPWLREFTREAVSCPIPVILGGHSLVSGSLWALSLELDPAGGGPCL
ncbi:MAG TPA: hypothetical protein PKO38_01595 [Bacillota bacterium]|nr:hypothetical protein [Bacillota bacterium]HOB86367.1 hypothetical protein [Bacillota bacterium]HPZ64191.1 hypothetical protein [Bacillota bacterium]HQD05246.1 hypothetical protein [Bacillota bacterium]